MSQITQQINKILRKKSPIVGGKEQEYEHLDWNEQEILQPLARLGPEAIEAMISIFKTPKQHYAVCRNIYLALIRMPRHFPDAKNQVVASLEQLLQDAQVDKTITMDSDMRRLINFELEILKKST